MAEAIRKDQQTENRNTTELTQSQDKGEVTRSTRAIGRKHKTDSPVSQVKFGVCVLYLHRTRAIILNNTRLKKPYIQ